MNGHIQYRGTAMKLRFIYQNIRNQQGFFYHKVSVIFQPSVLIVNVSATVSWLAFLR